MILRKFVLLIFFKHKDMAHQHGSAFFAHGVFDHICSSFFLIY